MYDIALYGILVKYWLLFETCVYAFCANEICTKDQIGQWCQYTYV